MHVWEGKNHILEFTIDKVLLYALPDSKPQPEEANIIV